MDKVVPKVPSDHWLLKNFRRLASDPLYFMSEMSKQHGGMVDLNISPWVDVFLVTNPEAIKYILIDNQRNYKKSFAYRFLKYALGNGLLTNEGESWLTQRRIAQPAFHRERLASLAGGMVENVQKMLLKWDEYVKLGNPVDVAAELMQLTTEIASRALFSHDIGGLTDQITRHITVVNEFLMHTISSPFRTPLWIPTSSNRTFKNTLKELDKIIYHLIESRRKSADQYYDLLTMLMEAQDEETGERMGDVQLKDEVMTLFLAGSETSSNALAWTIYLLSKHPEIKEKMYQEVESELKGETPNAENILRLKYTSMIIQESMRLYPPAWVIGREALKDDVIDGYKIKKRSQLYISPFVMHRHDNFWENAEKFEPLRFTPENNKKRPKFAYFPFGAGPRFCIGNNFAIMEITITLALIAQKKLGFKLVYDDVGLEPLVTLRPEKGLSMYLSR